MPLTSSTQIANLALSHLGQPKPIGSLNENSAAAAACKLHYDLVLDEVLGNFEWAFAKQYVDLALVSENPTTEWLYSYSYPSGCLRLRRILSGRRPERETLDTRVNFEKIQGPNGLLIYTNVTEPVAEITFRETVVEKYPSEFCQALSYRLAYAIGPSIIAGDPKGLRNTAGLMYNKMLAGAAGIDQSESVTRESDGSFIDARS